MDVLQRDESIVGILRAMLDNVSDTLIRVNRLQTVMTPKNGENLRTMSNNILFVFIWGERILTAAD
jgi:hypothetical protein